MDYLCIAYLYGKKAFRVYKHNTSEYLRSATVSNDLVTNYLNTV